MPNIQTAVTAFLSRAQVEQPGAVPHDVHVPAGARALRTLVRPPGHCRRLPHFIDGFAAGIGSYRTVLFLEMDSIITMPCLSRHGQAVREAELRYAINTLTADCPHLVIYMDSGAADALPARLAAKFLRASGVAKIQGFF